MASRKPKGQLSGLVEHFTTISMGSIGWGAVQALLVKGCKETEHSVCTTVLTHKTWGTWETRSIWLTQPRTTTLSVGSQFPSPIPLFKHKPGFPRVLGHCTWQMLPVSVSCSSQKPRRPQHTFPNTTLTLRGSKDKRALARVALKPRDPRRNWRSKQLLIGHSYARSMHC